ncbi:MAG TPA: hypothetical protein VNN25_27815 [Thermoanaerobaculia bacterium]|nr:hypothetical protein [Thermoanaerobaculia bacterium]
MLRVTRCDEREDKKRNNGTEALQSAFGRADDILVIGAGETIRVRRRTGRESAT